MKRKTMPILLTALAALLVALAVSNTPTSAQTGGGFDLTWSTIDGGGGTSAGGGYSLSGSIGQADAGTLSGGGYTLTGGFWSGAGADYRIYLPLTLKAAP